MRPSRLLPALAGLLLALTTLVAPTAAAAGTGTLTVVMVDENGDPMPGQIQLVSSTGPTGGPGIEGGGSTWTGTLPAGEYGLLAISPWGGLLCAGIADGCTYLAIVGGSVNLDGSVTVTEGQTTQVRIEGEKPVTLDGPARVGKKLTLDWSEGMQNLIDYFGAFGGGLYSPTLQWLRDGTPIDGATDDTYRPVGADAGRIVSAEVNYPDAFRIQFEQLTGQPVTPRTTNGLKVAKVSTESFTTVVDPTISAGRQGRVRVEVTAPNQIVTGKVRVRVGDWSQTRNLRNGSARVVLPQLAPGKHTISATYLGTSVYAPSTARPKTITVG